MQIKKKKKKMWGFHNLAFEFFAAIRLLTLYKMSEYKKVRTRRIHRRIYKCDKKTDIY